MQTYCIKVFPFSIEFRKMFVSSRPPKFITFVSHDLKKIHTLLLSRAVEYYDSFVESVIRAEKVHGCIEVEYKPFKSDKTYTDYFYASETEKEAVSIENKLLEVYNQSTKDMQGFVIGRSVTLKDKYIKITSSHTVINENLE